MRKGAPSPSEVLTVGDTVERLAHEPVSFTMWAAACGLHTAASYTADDMERLAMIQRVYDLLDARLVGGLYTVSLAHALVGKWLGIEAPTREPCVEREQPR